MKWQSIKNKIDPEYLAIALVGFPLITIFVSFRTALLVLCLLTTMTLFTIFLESIYILILSKESKTKHLNALLVTSSLVALSSIVLYFSFGSYALLKSLSMGLVLGVVILGYSWITNRKYRTAIQCYIDRQSSGSTDISCVPNIHHSIILLFYFFLIWNSTRDADGEQIK